MPAINALIENLPFFFFLMSFVLFLWYAQGPDSVPLYSAPLFLLVNEVGVWKCFQDQGQNDLPTPDGHYLLDCFKVNQALSPNDI